MLDGLAVPMIGLADLIANKRTVGRPRDLKDVKVLEALNAPAKVVPKRRAHPVKQ